MYNHIINMSSTLLPLCPVVIRSYSHHIWYDTKAYDTDSQARWPRFDYVPNVNEHCLLVLPSGKWFRAKVTAITAWQKTHVIILVEHVDHSGMILTLAVPYKYHGPSRTWWEWMVSWFRPVQLDQDYHVPGTYKWPDEDVWRQYEEWSPIVSVPKAAHLTPE